MATLMNYYNVAMISVSKESHTSPVIEKQYALMLKTWALEAEQPGLDSVPSWLSGANDLTSFRFSCLVCEMVQVQRAL